MVVVEPLSLPQATRNAAAAEPPPRAMNLRRETGSFAMRLSAFASFGHSHAALLVAVGVLPHYGPGGRNRINSTSPASARPGTGADPLQGAGDASDALRNPLRRHAGEGEAEAVLAALDHEVGAGDEGDALALGLGEQRGRVGPLGEIEPEEVAALGDDELGLGDLLAQSSDQGVATVAQRALDEVDVGVELAGATELQHDGLGQHVGRDVGLVGALGQLRDLRRRPGQVADPDPGADRLREGGGVDDPVGRVDREHRLHRLALEGKLAVGIVLEDPEAVLGGELDQSRALRRRERAAGGVVEVGDDVGELDRTVVQRRLEGADVEPVGLQRHRHQLDSEPLQHQQRAVVGRLLDHDPVTGLEQVLEQHPARLQRPVGDHHLPGVEIAVPLGDPLAEAGMPDPRPVGERLFPILSERNRGSVPHRVPRQDVGAGSPASE